MHPQVPARMRYANLLAALITIAFNALANALPLNGKTTGEISDSLPVLFVPAGYVFSIWAAIYIGWLVFAAYQFLPAGRGNARLQRLGALFVLSCAANIGWLILWHYERFIYTVPVMLSLLACLVAIYLRLEIGRARAKGLERWAVDVPFSLYLGWISVATIANISAVLRYLNWSGWGLSAEAWAVIMIVATGALGLAVLATRRDIAYALVLIWAAAGIAVKQTTASTVMAAAWALVAVLAAAAVGLAAKDHLPAFTRYRADLP